MLFLVNALTREFDHYRSRSSSFFFFIGEPLLARRAGFRHAACESGTATHRAGHAGVDAALAEIFLPVCLDFTGVHI